MSDELTDEQIREVAYQLWEEAGSPPGQGDEFWAQARRLLRQRHGHIDIDAASEESFPASDPINHM